MIDNTEKIRELLKFPNEHSFYFVEIMRRRKENPEMLKHAEIVKDFYVTSLKGFDSQVLKMKDYCNKFNARAYFRLNVRDARKIALQCNKRLAELMITEDWKALKNMYASVVGEFHSDPDKTWVVDLDKDGDTEEDKLNFLTNFAILEHKFRNEEVFVTSLDTKNGVHLITKPFRLDTFREWAAASEISVDVHKDNPTILYQP